MRQRGARRSKRHSAVGSSPVAIAALLFAGALLVARGIGSEFMPPLNEGDLMFMPIADEGGVSTPMVPRSAVQNVGDRTVVYLVNPKQPGTFVEREVRLGTVTSDRVSVLAGVQIGDVVVGEGSFSVRAERECLGLRAALTSSGTAASTSDARSGVMQGDIKVQEVRVTVTETSFDSQRLTLRAGVPARVTFTRTSDKTCATAVVFPSLNIRRELPLNEAVTIEFTPDKAGEIAFACGMNMLRGTVVVQ